MCTGEGVTLVSDYPIRGFFKKMSSNCDKTLSNYDTKAQGKLLNFSTTSFSNTVEIQQFAPTKNPTMLRILK
ncbi:hypothetical protein DFP79_3373 [Marinomonas balearica]|uniref:Uncharacterized protein n=1 Tax=Marinomonas balearica TaxID=491947 RepID=A0A4R6M405_9GAMM|nr:hypothetical protein DFP79_3373 [Marinomonas balearica]